MADILIAGAGLGGLTAALVLIQRGHRVRIFEQATELREVGAGVQLGANGTRILIALGLEAAMRRVVCAAAGKEVRLGSTGFEQTADSVTLRLSNGEHVTGDLLIGADGVHSRIRQQMHGQGAAHFTGLMAWRGLVPMDRLPPHQRTLVGVNWLGVGGHVVTYPLRRGELLNFVGVVERDDWRTESWNEPGTREECLRDLNNWHDDVKTIIRNIDTPFKWALLGRDPLDHFAQGRVCVMGDAAHPTLPFLAQGANMALEDAVVLARCLEVSDGPEALRRYEAARLTRTAAIVRGSSDNTKRFHNPALAHPEGAAAYVEREFQPEKVRQRYDWLYEYDALTVAV